MTGKETSAEALPRQQMDEDCDRMKMPELIRDWGQCNMLYYFYRKDKLLWFPEENTKNAFCCRLD